jgi:hypothetical protein
MRDLLYIGWRHGLRLAGRRLGVGDRNGRLIDDFDCLREWPAAEIGILLAAVARVPARVDRQIHQVRQSPDLLRASGLAAGEGAKCVEIDGLFPF